MIPSREQNICGKKKIAELKIMNDLSKLCHKRLWSITFKSHAFEFFFSGQ